MDLPSLTRRVLPLALCVSLLALGAPSAGAGAASGPSDSAGEYGSGPLAPPEPASPSSPSTTAWQDVGGPYSWAKSAIDFVAKDRPWMRDFGTDKFRPGLAESRVMFAGAIVKAFGAPGATPDAATTFSDLDAADPGFKFAALAVENGWMNTDGAKFRPDAPMTMHSAYRALVLAEPLLDDARKSLGDLHDASGYRFKQPSYFPTTELGMRMYLRYNHPKEAADILPNQPMPRAEVAYALRRAATISDGELQSLGIYEDIELPKMDGAMRRVVEFGIEYVGYPYIWGGEWFKPNSSQPTGGWDCSGYMWWIAKAPAYGYDNTRVRGYRGWNLPQRTSATMAAKGARIGFNDLKPGMLMFYDGSPGSGANVDHVDMYIGNGYALDTSSGVGGTTLLWVKTGWYRDHFRWGRKIM